jgi:hypothetical protein
VIEPTDEMVQLAVDKFLHAPVVTIREIDAAMRDALTAALALAERQWQEQWGDAYQRGWWRGQHQLCPRCGVELEREVAAERGRPADPFGPIVDPCGGCGCAKSWHLSNGCSGDFTHCRCKAWKP